MKLFDVYPLQPIELSYGKGTHVFDTNGNEYLDLYGGHAVISIGHNHPHFNDRISDQLQKIPYYSNSVINKIQVELARELGEQSGYTNHNLFLCNSGAEANDNALKIASFHNKKSRLLAFRNSFHGRTSRTLSVTDNPKYRSPMDEYSNVTFLDLNDTRAVKEELSKGDVCAVIIEGIQGVGGINIPENSFLKSLRQLCTDYDTVLILDEIQSGYGRTGKFFAHQYAGIEADIVTVAKGMGNGFPIAGVLISPKVEAFYGMLGTTFGGNHLASAAGLAVLEVLKEEELIPHAARVGNAWMDDLLSLSGVRAVRGKGLMIGIELYEPIKEIRKKLLEKHKILTGVATNPYILRLLPPLSLQESEAERFISCFEDVL